MRLTIKRTIDAGVETVFATYTDPARLPEWQPGVKGLRELTGPLDQPGTTYLLDQPGPPMRITVLRVEPPRLHEQLEEIGWYSWIGTARFEPLINARTRFSYRYSVEGRRRWLVGPLVAIAALVFGRAEFNRLKEVAERVSDDTRGIAGLEARTLAADGVRIRGAGLHDVEALATLTAELGYRVDPGELLPRVRSVLADPDDHQLRVAVDDDDVPIGWVHVERLRVLELPAAAQLMGLVVGDRHRSGGIGAALLAEAEAIARGWGCQSLLVRSNVVRGRAHPFYERAGYARVKTSYLFEKRLNR